MARSSRKHRFFLLFVVLCLPALLHAQEPVQLEPGKPVEREIAGGQIHLYQINLSAGQFMRVAVNQNGVDVVVALLGPDGQQVVEVDQMAGSFGLESLSHEAAAAGSYRIKIFILSPETPKGVYQLSLELQATASAADQKRITAERLMPEVSQITKEWPASTRSMQAAEKALQALAVWREIGDQYEEAVTLNLVALIYCLTDQYQQVIEVSEQALVISQRIGDRAIERMALSYLGVAWHWLGHFDKIIKYFEQVLTIFPEFESSSASLLALRYLGEAYMNLGRYEKAIEYQEKRLRVARSEKYGTLEKIALSGLGGIYLKLGQYEKAIEYREQELSLAQAEKNRPAQGIARLGLGEIYYNLGSYEKALEQAEQALATFRAMPMKIRIAEGYALMQLGIVNYFLGNYERAVECLEPGLALIREGKDRPNEATLLSCLGRTLAALGRYEEATQHLNLSLTINRQLKLRSGEAIAIGLLGDVQRLQGRYAEAIELYNQSLAIGQQLKFPYGEAYVLSNLMLAWKSLGQTRFAIFLGKQAVNVNQSLRGNITSLDRGIQRGFLKSKEETYRTLADLLIAQGRVPEAEQVIHLLKEEEYFEFIRRDQANTPQGSKAQLTPEEQALEKRYREIADQLAGLGAERGALLDKQSRTPVEEQRLATLEADLVVAGQAFQKFMDGLADELGKGIDANARIFQLREAQGLMGDLRELGKGVVALYTLVGEDKYRVILTTADVQKAYESPIKAADLNRKILEFRAVLQNPKLDPLPLAQELYKILVAPVAKDLKAAKAETLMWSLDGVLRYVPMAALHDGDKYLVERFRNVVFTPASQARLKDAPSRNWRALGLGVTKAHGERIPALPGVAEEMRGIIKEEGSASGVLPGTIKLDEAFTQEAMLTGLRQRPPVVHVASHFQFQPGNETNSALLLGDGSFLSLAQIKSLPNVFSGVELLTLSACNTATGGSGANGKEVEGFGVLAQRQGAKAVIASLWPVFDTSTKELMQDFYQLREAKQDTTKAEALRQAQLRLLRVEKTITAEATLASRQITHEEDKKKNSTQPLFKPDPKRPYAHPYYWAPFILIGNWK